MSHIRQKVYTSGEHRVLLNTDGLPQGVEREDYFEGMLALCALTEKAHDGLTPAATLDRALSIFVDYTDALDATILQTDPETAVSQPIASRNGQSHGPLETLPDDATAAEPPRVFSVPICSSLETPTVLEFTVPAAAASCQERQRLLTAFAQQIGLLCERACLLQTRETQRRLVNALREASRSLNANLDLKRVINRILDQLAQVLPYDGAGVLQIHRDEAPIIETRGDLPFRLPKQGTDAIHPHEIPVLECLMATGKPLVIQDTEGDERWPGGEWDSAARSWIGVPLIARSQVMGILSIHHAHAGAFGDRQVEVALAFAALAAIAIHNAHLLHETTYGNYDLKQAHQQLQEARRLRDEMAQNVSHELRTPLTHIRGNVELILSGLLGNLANDEQRESLSVVLEKTDKLISMVQDVITYQEISSELLNLTDVPLTEIAGRLMVSLRSLAEANGVILVADWSADLPPALVDRERIKRVFFHLLDNAIKFSPHGGKVTVSIRRAGEGFIVSVSDTGIGISPDRIDSIFQVFYQADGSTTREFEGMGLGLALTRRIVEAHDGRIWVTSEPDKGSTFYFTLPEVAQTAPS